MRPHLSSNNRRYAHLCNAKHFGELTLKKLPAGVQGSNLQDRRVVEKSLALSRPTRHQLRMLSSASSISARLSSLSISVSHIVLVGAQEKVGGVTARRIVAAVENMHPIGDVPVGNGPRDAMSLPVFALNSDLSVSPMESASGPRPTGIRAARLVNFVPKFSNSLCGNIKTHLKPPVSCATPPAVPTARGSFRGINSNRSIGGVL